MLNFDLKSVDFYYLNQEDYLEANKWHRNDVPALFFAKPQQDDLYKQPKLCLLIHYNPLKTVLERLFPNKPVSFKKWPHENQGLPSEFKDEIKTFKQKMEEQGQKYGIDIINMERQAELIICCWGEFMEEPYLNKHLFYGQSFGELWIYENEDYFRTQPRPVYD